MFSLIFSETSLGISCFSNMAGNTFYRFLAQGIDADLLDIDIQKAGDYKNITGLHCLYEVGFSPQINHQHFVNASLSENPVKT